MKIGIIGNGVVGDAIHQNLVGKIDELYVYDVDPVKSLSSWDSAVNSDIVFICLPTPMLNRKSGVCDLSSINELFKKLTYGLTGLFVIKSTIPIGTTQNLSNQRKDLKIIHNPEFLTERNSVNDFNQLKRNIIGGPEKLTQVLKDFYLKYFEKSNCILVESNESEAIKYFSNIFLCLKVTYFNQLYDLCEKMGMDFETVRRCIVLDRRIGESHSFVPGFDGERGFGGKCFPKDINALIYFFKEHGLDEAMLMAAWEYNMKIRKNVNW